jgi:hypothetical protein
MTVFARRKHKICLCEKSPQFYDVFANFSLGLLDEDISFQDCMCNSWRMGKLEVMSGLLFFVFPCGNV